MRYRASSLLLVLLCGCATLAREGKGDVDLPSQRMGPFRMLKHGAVCDEAGNCSEIGELPTGTPDGVPKYPGSPKSRAPTVLVRGSGGRDLRLVLYAARDLEAGPARIARFESEDAREFPLARVVEVMKADQPFEGESMSDPWAIEVGGEVWIYYSILPSKAGPTPGQIPGIARARSTDGLDGRAFAKEKAPVLTFEGHDALETEPPRAPSVIRLPSGELRLFYASGNHIWEAASTDGITFTRKKGPVMEPRKPIDLGTLKEGEKPPFDDLAVDDPCMDRIVTESGRALTRALYTGRDARGGVSVGFAGRFGDEGSFAKNEGSVFGQKNHGNAPAIARFPDFTLLYANRDENLLEPAYDPKVQVLGIAISPERTKLPLP